MRNKFYVGIDLGTSTSEIAIYKNDGQIEVLEHPWYRTSIIDSVLSYYKGNIYLGPEARGLRLYDNVVYEFKRDMGKERIYFSIDNIPITPIHASALILKYLKWIAEQNGYAFEEAVISIPANYSQDARYATILAAELAGIKLVKLINEPTAAIISYGLNEKFRKIIRDLKPIMVVDFGGGTLDITVMQAKAFDSSVVFDSLASFGDPKLGGKDIDEEISNYIRKRINCDISDHREIKRLAEQVKIGVSRSPSFRAYLPLTLDCVYEEQFTIDQVENIIMNGDIRLEMRIRTTVEETIRRASRAYPSLSRKDMEVILVGGAVKFPLVRRIIEQIFNKQAYMIEDPQLAVSKGAAIACAQEKRAIASEIILVDVSPFGIGVEVVDPDTLRTFYDPLIQPNTRIPYEIRKNYILMDPRQNRLNVPIYQTRDYADQRTPLENLEVTPLQISVDNIPPASGPKPWPVRLKFMYNSSGMIEIEVTILDYVGNALKQETIIFTPTDLSFSSEEIDKMKEEIEHLWRMVRL